MITHSVTGTYTRHAVQLTLDENLPPIPVRHTASTMIKPRSVRLTYTDNGQGWRDDTPRVTGQRIKKDGTPGQATAEVNFWESYVRPDWLVELVEYYRPSEKV